MYLFILKKNAGFMINDFWHSKCFACDLSANFHFFFLFFLFLTFSSPASAVHARLVSVRAHARDIEAAGNRFAGRACVGACVQRRCDTDCRTRVPHNRQKWARSLKFHRALVLTKRICATFD